MVFKWVEVNLYQTKNTSEDSILACTFVFQGWLTEKTSPVFDMRLRYYDPSPGRGSAPSFTGNISEWEWQHKDHNGNSGIDNSPYVYAFDYDKLSRLTDSRLFKGNAITPEDNFTERNISYDRNGNIKTLQRKDDSWLKNYAFTYDGNQISSFDDNGNITDRITYDANGNQLSYGDLEIFYGEPQ